MRVLGPATATAIISAVIEAVGRPGEECSAEIYAAIFLLVRSGLIVSSTASSDQSAIAADTVLTSSRSLTGFTWADSLCGEYPA